MKRTLQQARADVPIEEIMFELVRVAAQASVARTITVVRTILKQTKSIFKYAEDQQADALGKPRAAWYRVIEKQFRFPSFSARGGERGPVFCLQLIGLEL